MSKFMRLFMKNSILVPLISIVLGLFIGALIMLLGSYNPLDAYGSLFERAFGSTYSIGETIREITPLIFTGLAVAFAFRTGLFNIGAEGQFIVGSLAAAFIGITVDLPWYLHAPLAFLVAGVVGGLWGAIAGYLKAKHGVHEVIVTIMLNWTALYFSNYLVKAFLLEPGQQRSSMVNESSLLTFPALQTLFDSARVHLGAVLAIICAFLFFIILWKTKQGFELRAVGLNPHASEYAGINVQNNIVKSMFISGAFAGFGGATQVLGVFQYQQLYQVSPGYGFDGIAVALIGGSTGLGVVFAAILLGVLKFGATGMKFGAGVPVELINIVIALVIFFVAASGMVKQIVEFFRKIKANKSNKNIKGEAEEPLKKVE